MSARPADQAETAPAGLVAQPIDLGVDRRHVEPASLAGLTVYAGPGAGGERYGRQIPPSGGERDVHVPGPLLSGEPVRGHEKAQAWVAYAHTEHNGRAVVATIAALRALGVEP